MYVLVVIFLRLSSFHPTSKHRRKTSTYLTFMYVIFVLDPIGIIIHGSIFLATTLFANLPYKKRIRLTI